MSVSYLLLQKSLKVLLCLFAHLLNTQNSSSQKLEARYQPLAITLMATPGKGLFHLPAEVGAL